jgi:hypothetical protein
MEYERTLTMLLLLLLLFIIIAVSGSTAISLSAVNGTNADDTNHGLAPFAPKPLTDFSKAVPDSTPGLNFLNKSSPYYGKISPPSTPPGQIKKVNSNVLDSNVFNLNTLLSTALPDSGYGSWIANNPNYIAVYVQHQIQPNLDLVPNPNGSDVILYAPTVQFPNHCPLEQTMEYYQNVYTHGNTQRIWGVYRHSDTPSQNGWVVQKVVDSTFLSNYVRTDGDGRSWYYTEIGILPGASGWSVILYNYNTQNWEYVYTTTSQWSGFTQGGWDFFETHYNGIYQPTIPEIQASGIMLIDNTPYHMSHFLDSSTGGSLLNYGPISQVYHTQMIYPYYKWSVYY